MLTLEQARQVVKEIIEEIYVDGIDEVVEFFNDEEKNTLWGTFRDADKTFDFVIDLNDGTLTY